MAYQSGPGDLALHGVRVLGFPAASDLLATLGIERGTDT